MLEEEPDVDLVTGLIRRPPLRDKFVCSCASVMLNVGERTEDEVLVVIECECVKAFVDGEDGGDHAL